MTSTSKSIDINKLYLDLLDVYTNKTNEDFIKEKKKTSELLKDVKYKFEYSDNYIPYPDYDDDEFNKKIYSKKNLI
jgi:hypothetical protein